MLRLTLRTLLAYLDDTLEPTEARDIGQRIKDNPQTQELIERCKTVMRRRRLNAPSPDPDEATLDANIVAAYLDNSLPHEKVAKAEKQFLKSDTDLAEVCCVHQILSMVLGNPADISRETRNRAYALVGGTPEKPVLARPIGPTPTPADPRPVDARLIDSQPLPLAIPAYNAGMGTRGVLMTVGIVLMLTVALVGVIWKVVSPTSEKADITSQIALGPGLQPTEPEPQATPADIQEPRDEATDEKPAQAPSEPESKPGDLVDPGDAPVPVPLAPTPEEMPDETKVAEKEESKDAVAKEEVPPAPPTPPTPAEPPQEKIDATIPVATYRAAGSVLLKQTELNTQRLRQDGFVFIGDTLVNLDGFRSQVHFPSKASLELVDMVRLNVLPAEEDSFACDLERGRLVFRGGNENFPFRVRFNGKTLPLEIIGPNALVGIEIELDSLLDPTLFLRIQTVRGEVAVQTAGEPISIPAGNAFVLSNRVAEPEIQTVDSYWNWISDTPDHALKRSTDVLAGALPYGEGLEIELLLREKLTARTAEVRRLAVRALAAVHAVEILIDAMSFPDDAEVRQTAIKSLREALYYAPELATAVRDNLYLLYDEKLAHSIQKMVIGYTIPERSKMETYEDLVAFLQHDRLVVRELAIYNLKTMTGRDMGYAADATLLRRNTPMSQWNRWLAELNPQSLPVTPGS